MASIHIKNRSFFNFSHCFAAIAVAAIPSLLFGYAEGPPAGHAGVPNEETCKQCHSGPGGSGSVAASGFSTGMTYTPGAAQTLTVTVSDPAQRRWGFQLTARVHDSPQTQAGSFTPGSDGFTQLACGAPPFSNGSLANSNRGDACATQSDAPLQYIEHTPNGTRLGQPGSATFTFTWTPPSTSVGPIDIYVAGNAANGNGAPSGDNIYTASYTLAPAPSGPPSISAGGVVNAAGFQSSIASGSWVAITGANLCGTTRTWNAGDFSNNGQTEPQKLEDVTVTMGGLPAFVYYVSATQINVQAPTLPPGPVSVMVSNANGTSQSTANVAAVSPAFFLWNGKYAVATRPDFTYVGPPGLFPSITTTPAKPGDTVILWGTGFGATTPAVPPGTLTPSILATVNDQVTVTVGGLSAEYKGGALTPGNAGLYQIAITIPANAPNGDLPVLASIDGVQTPTGVSINVQQ